MRYEFGDFILQTDRVELTREGVPVPLEPKTFDLLVFLVENRDRVVSKDDILDRIWPGLFVSEASVSTAIKQVRRALGDDGGTQAYVKTVLRKGFRFAAPVAAAQAAPAQPRIETPAPVAAPGPGRAPVVAVLPFHRVQSTTEHGAIAEAIPIELISALSRSRGVRVIARASSFRFDPVRFDPAEIRARLGAGYVLSGAVEQAGTRLIVTMELLETQDGAVIWGDRYDGPLDALFAIRERATREVCAAIELRVPLHEAAALARVPTEALDAWGHYHLGLRHLYRTNAVDIDRARHHMERAIALDPGFARAYAGLSFAEAEVYNLFYGVDRAHSLARTVEMAERGAELDPDDPFCSLVLGRARWYGEDLDGAIAWTDRAIALDPNHAFARYNAGKLATIACIGQEGDALVASAMDLSPLDPHLQSMLSARAAAGFVVDDREAALGHAKASLRAPNPHLYVKLFAAAILQVYGAEAEARQALVGVREAYPGFTKAHFRSLFTLRDPERNETLLRALASLGV